MRITHLYALMVAVLALSFWGVNYVGSLSPYEAACKKAKASNARQYEACINYRPDNGKGLP